MGHPPVDCCAAAGRPGPPVMLIGKSFLDGEGSPPPVPHFLDPGETCQLAEPRSWACGWKERESGTSHGWLAAGDCAGTPGPEGTSVTGSSSINLWPEQGASPREVTEARSWRSETALGRGRADWQIHHPQSAA